MKNNNIIFDVFCSIILLLATICLIGVVFGLKLDINLSESLPYKIFISNSNFKYIKNGDYIKFVNPRANYYQNKIFIRKGILDYTYIKYPATPIIYEDVSYLVKSNENIRCEISWLDNITNEKIIGIIKLYIENHIVKEVFIYRYY